MSRFESKQAFAYWCRRRYEFGNFELGGCVREENGAYHKETLHMYGDVYYLRVEHGKRTPWWELREQKYQSWSTDYLRLTVEDAQNWVKEHLEPAAYQAIFGYEANEYLVH